MSEKLQQFETDLKRHDWYFDYSDDHGVWVRGMSSVDRLRRIHAELVAEGLMAEANALWNKYAPDSMGIV
jgi:hypothetical protein